MKRIEKEKRRYREIIDEKKEELICKFCFKKFNTKAGLSSHLLKEKAKRYDEIMDLIISENDTSDPSMLEKVIVPVKTLLIYMMAIIILSELLKLKVWEEKVKK